MKKIIELDDFFSTGENTVQPVLPWGSGRVDTTRITKHASEALDYIKNVSPEPGNTLLLLLAMGATETYGPNRNGDGFSEHPVAARGKVASADRKWYVPPGEELTKHYQSFEKNPAHTFKHHANRDPSKASGVVKKAFWNDRMHRVELLVKVSNELDPEWVQRTNDGEFVPVSMGCRIKRDVCSICGNEAPTRADYCDHAKYAMNQILPDGQKVFVHNPSPDFFDISRVFRPADRIGYTLKKVAEVYEVRLSAELGERADALALKGAAAQKLSDITKVINCEPTATSTLSKDEKSFIVKFRDHTEKKLASAPRIGVAELAAWPLGEVLSAASANGVVFKDAEFIWLTTNKLAGRQVATNIEKVAAASNYALELFASRPELLDEVLDSGALESSKIASELMSFFADVREKRGYFGEYLYRRLVPEGVGLRDDAAPTTDVLRMGPYATTRGAAIDAQDATTRAHMGKIVGGSALLYGGYKALTAFPWMRRMKLPLAAGAAMLGAKTLGQRPGQTMVTDEGYQIPESTELTMKNASQEAIVHLIECASSTPTAHVFSSMKIASNAVLDDVAAALGEIILAR
jgi:hypothetical protein